MSEDYRFAALVELMDSLGASFVVRPPDEVGYVGAELPEWCDFVVVQWLELIVYAYAGVASGHHLYACTECCFPMLLTSARKERRCPACSTAKAMTYRLPIHFLDPPARRKPGPRRPTEEEPTAPPDDEPRPPAWPNCSHSLGSRRPDGTILCSYCLQEVTP